MSEPKDNVNWDALEALAAESRAGKSDDDDIDDVDDVEEIDDASAGKRGAAPKAEASRASTAERKETDKERSAKGAGDKPMSGRVKAALRHSTVRPGQEDTLRSPLVLGLGGGAAVLLLVGATFYFMINRQTTEEAFNESKQFYEDGKYGQAITAFTSFLALHGQHELADPAMMYRGRAEVDKAVRTEKNYPDGLTKLRGFVSEFQDFEELFPEHVPFVAERAQQIALEAAEQAGKTKKEDLLQTSNEAQVIFTTWAAPELKPQEAIARIEAARRVSQAAILKFKTEGAAATKIDAALKSSDTMGAIDSWRELVGRYSELRNDAKIAALLSKILDAEKQRVTVEPVEVAALSAEPVIDTAPPLTFAFHARSSTDEVSGGRCVLAVSKDCLYGIDTITGAPVWRRVIGVGTPFFPVIEPATGATIAFSTQSGELQKIDTNTGALVWRVPVDAFATSTPLLVGGRLLLPTVGGTLVEVSLSDGAISRRVRFSQPIASPALMPGGERMAVVGDQEVFYVLNLASLECERVQYLGDGHAAGSIRAPVLSEGPYLIVCENQPAQNASQLRIINAAQTSGELAEVQTAKIDGLVVDTPVVRGQDLFVPSTGERVSAFTLSDTAGQPVLTVGPVFSGRTESQYPIYLSTGPERQVWLASTSVRRLQVIGGELRPDQTQAAVGFTSQPLQYVDRKLFNGRRRAFTDAVTVTRMDREQLTSDAQAIIGARLLAWNAREDALEALVVANEGGAMFRAEPARWATGGIQIEGADRLPLHEDLNEPLYGVAIDKGALAIAAGGPEPKLFVINGIGRLDRSYPLSGSPTGELSFLSGRVLVPMQGKVKLASIVSGQSAVEDFTLPTEEAPSARWKYVAATSETDAVAVLESGDVLLLRYQSTPRHYLSQVTRLSLGAPVHVRGDQGNGLVVVGDGQGVVHLFEATGLSETGNRNLGSPIAGDVFLSGDLCFVPTADGQLLCLNAAADLATRWALPLEGTLPAGRPLSTAAGLLVALRDGRLLVVDPASGAVTKTVSTGQGLAGGPFVVGTQTYIPTLDGSLVRLPEGVAP